MHLLAALGLSWQLLGRSWAALGRSWPLLGRSWGALGRSWAALGALLGSSWAPLGRSWGALGALLDSFFSFQAALGTARKIISKSMPKMTLGYHLCSMLRVPRAPFSRITRFSTCEIETILGSQERRSRGIRMCF